MESVAIAEKMEQLHPDASLHLESGLQVEAAETVGQIAKPVIPKFMPCVIREVVREVL